MYIEIKNIGNAVLTISNTLCPGEAKSGSDSDESADEDFVAGETPDTSPPSSSETEEGEEGEEKKKKKKVIKETEINGEKGVSVNMVK